MSITTLSWEQDRRAFVDATPEMAGVVVFAQGVIARSLDSAGIALARRITRALLLGTVAYEPDASDPIAYRHVYGTMRRLLLQTLAYLIDAPVSGNDGPLLLDTAAAGLAGLELIDAADDGDTDPWRTLTATLLVGMTWRADTYLTA